MPRNSKVPIYDEKGTTFSISVATDFAWVEWVEGSLTSLQMPLRKKVAALKKI